MSAFRNTPAKANQRIAENSSDRVTTIISCPGVKPMGRLDNGPNVFSVANENRWFDRLGFKRQWYANIASFLLTLLLLWGGVWVVTEFVRLQQVEKCFESGRRDCLPLDFNRRGR